MYLPSHPPPPPPKSRKFHGQRSLVGYSPWGRKESNMTEHTTLHSQPPKSQIILNSYPVFPNSFKKSSWVARNSCSSKLVMTAMVRDTFGAHCHSKSERKLHLSLFTVSPPPHHHQQSNKWSFFIHFIVIKLLIIA